MECAHFEAGRCRSCTWLPLPRATQVEDKEQRLHDLLTPFSVQEWLPSFVGAESGFRNKAKMVVSGSVEEPVLGILGADGTGVDLTDCALYAPGLVSAMPALRDFITLARLVPYDVAARRGELKHLLVTEAPSGALMVRFVLRSTESVLRITKHLPTLLASVAAELVSVNLQPEHKAVLEGEEEQVLHGETLTMTINDLDLHLRPQSFFQTNTEVAAVLYRRAVDWVDALNTSGALAPDAALWDLYSGVGGFALHLSTAGDGSPRTVTGVEVSAEATASARRTADDLGLGDASFVTADATSWALERPTAPDLVVVNPPRRGIGADLAGWLETSGARFVLYSSCNAESLARDLTSMPSWRPVRAQMLDMFPHTAHYEVLVLLARRP